MLEGNTVIKIENSIVYVDVSTVAYPNTYTLISEEDLYILKNSYYKWVVARYGKKMYVRTTPNTSLLHNILLPPKEGYVPDHINRNTLDNRRINLRYVTHKENAMNRGLNSNNTTGFKGVYKSRNKFAAICAGYRIGTYSTCEQAAKAYDTYALKKYGDKVSTNKSLGILKL